jgi:hypothetical protein
VQELLNHLTAATPAVTANNAGCVSMVGPTMDVLADSLTAMRHLIDRWLAEV